MQCGPVRHRLTRSEQVETATRRVLITRDTGFDPSATPRRSGHPGDPRRGRRRRRPHATYRDRRRRGADREPLPAVLTERREHLGAIAELLEAATDRIVVLHGGMGVKARRRADEMLASDGPRVVLATGRYIGEGFDDPRPAGHALARDANRVEGHDDAVRLCACTATTTPSTRSASSTTSTTPFPRPAACTQSASAPTQASATRPADGPQVPARRAGR